MTDLIERLQHCIVSEAPGSWRKETMREAADRIAALETEAVKHERALLTVQNAAKTLASAGGTELEHLRQNHAIDHKLRAEHDSLIERDALMTDALLKAEARIAALEAEASEGERRGLERAAEVADQHYRNRQRSWKESRVDLEGSRSLEAKDIADAIRALIPEAQAQPELASAAANQLSTAEIGLPEAPAREGWQPIETAPELDRVLVAGWQKPTRTVQGYWWMHEDVIVDGKPCDHPEALLWMPFPDRPVLPPPPSQDREPDHG